MEAAQNDHMTQARSSIRQSPGAARLGVRRPTSQDSGSSPPQHVNGNDWCGQKKKSPKYLPAPLFGCVCANSECRAAVRFNFLPHPSPGRRARRRHYELWHYLTGLTNDTSPNRLFLLRNESQIWKSHDPGPLFHDSTRF